MLAWALAAALGATSVPSNAATGSTVVGATVLSATNIGAGGCAPGTTGVTNFGAVTAPSNNVTTSNCIVTFGSSNDVARLRVAQADGHGSAMFRPSRGDRDTGVSGDGVATFAPSTGDDVLASVAVQADGKVVVAGTYDAAGVRRPMVARYTAAGVPDGTFDGDGLVQLTTLDSHPWSQPQVTIDPQGRIILAWVANSPTGNVNVARFSSSGVPDGTFGTVGVASHALSGGGNTGWINDVTVDDQGRILLTGRLWPMVEWTWTGIAARLTPTGGMDGTLGGDGIIVLACPSSTYSEMAFDVVALPGGSFLTSNSQTTGATTTHVAKWAANGTLDGTFGTGGCADLTVGGGSGLAVDSAGRVLVGASSAVVRLTAAGVPDNAFGASGVATVSGYVRDVAVDADGTIVASWLDGPFRTARLSSTGTPVSWHGTGGVATITVGGDTSGTEPQDMALAPDGHIVQVGRDTSDGTAFDAVIVRTAAVRVSNFETGVHDWSVGGATGVFGACLRDATNGAVSNGTTWTSNLGVACPASNGAIWRGIPETTADPAALVARTTTATTTNPTATLQFGLRAAGSQPAGDYLAPVSFEVVAP